MLMPRNLNRRQPPQRGVAAVEFAFILVLLLIIMAGVVEFGRVFWYFDALTKGTRDAARYLSDSAALDQTTARNIVAQAALAARVPDFDQDDNVAISCTPDCNTPDHVTVAVVDYNIDLGSWFPILTNEGGVLELTIPVTPSTTMRYLQ